MGSRKSSGPRTIRNGSRSATMSCSMPNASARRATTAARSSATYSTADCFTSRPNHGSPAATCSPISCGQHRLARTRLAVERRQLADGQQMMHQPSFRAHGRSCRHSRCLAECAPCRCRGRCACSWRWIVERCEFCAHAATNGASTRCGGSCDSFWIALAWWISSPAIGPTARRSTIRAPCGSMITAPAQPACNQAQRRLVELQMLAAEIARRVADAIGAEQQQRRRTGCKAIRRIERPCHQVDHGLAASTPSASITAAGSASRSAGSAKSNRP